MPRKKNRITDSEGKLTMIFLGMLLLAASAGLFGQIQHLAGAH
jgi:hypothetical protein